MSTPRSPARPASRLLLGKAGLAARSSFRPSSEGGRGRLLGGRVEVPGFPPGPLGGGGPQGTPLSWGQSPTLWFQGCPLPPPKKVGSAESRSKSEEAPSPQCGCAVWLYCVVLRNQRFRVTESVCTLLSLGSACTFQVLKDVSDVLSPC